MATVSKRARVNFCLFLCLSVGGRKCTWVGTNDLLKLHITAVNFFKLLWLKVYIQTKIFLNAFGQGHLTIMTDLTHGHVSHVPTSYASEGDCIIMGRIQLAFISKPEGNVVAIHGISIHSAWFCKRKQINNILLLLENTKLFCHIGPKLYSCCNEKLLATYWDISHLHSIHHWGRFWKELPRLCINSDRHMSQILCGCTQIESSLGCHRFQGLAVSHNLKVLQECRMLKDIL